MAEKKFPLRKEEKINLLIDGINHAGEGVGRCNGMTVFVPVTVPGDTVQAEVVALKKNYARARLVNIIEHSPARKEPECTHFLSCGGCRLQHMDYGEQLRLKTVLVRDSINRIAGLNGVTVNETVGMDYPWHYRNKVSLHVQECGEGYELGFYEEGSHKLAGFFKEGAGSNSGCLLVDRELNEAALIIEMLINKHGDKFHLKRRTDSFFRHVVLRKAFNTGEIMVVLVTRSGDWPQQKAFTDELLSLWPGFTSVVRNINDGPPGIILGGENLILAGRDYITDRLGNLAFTISPLSFYQVNPVQTMIVYRKALEYAALTGKETVIDAYSGIGTIALFLAGQARKVLGIELVARAVEDARQNALLNKINNVAFHHGKVEKLLPALTARGLHPDVAVLDPPRKGCERKTLEVVSEMKVPRVVYVSCNPGTLARDCRYLAGKGYRVEEVQPVDMFPWNAHVESIILIKRAESRM